MLSARCEYTGSATSGISASSSSSSSAPSTASSASVPLDASPCRAAEPVASAVDSFCPAGSVVFSNIPDVSAVMAFAGSPQVPSHLCAVISFADGTSVSGGRGTLTTRSSVGAIVIFRPFCSYAIGVSADSVAGSCNSPDPDTVLVRNPAFRRCDQLFSRSPAFRQLRSRTRYLPKTGTLSAFRPRFQTPPCFPGLPSSRTRRT